MLTTNNKIFKAYDIRGVYGQDFDESFAFQLGLAFVALRKNDPDYVSGSKLRIAVGMDMRLSSPVLKDSLVKGLVAGGAEAIDFGLTATPTLYFAVGHYKYSGGIMVSASHNPKEWNGFKLVRAEGRPISGESGLNWIKEYISSGQCQNNEASVGLITQGEGALAAEIAYALSFNTNKTIKPLKIVADAANGMGATFLNPLLAALPVTLIPVNFELDGRFPSHEADPLKPENMDLLSRTVIAEKADLGIATDGDGDRVFFMDNQGRTVDPAIVRGLLAELFLEDKPGANIGFDVRPGKITIDLIEAAGGHAVPTRVGHSLIKEQMLKEDIYFAGESSGHFFLKGIAGCFEYPPVMIIKMLQRFSNSDLDSASFLKAYYRYFHSGEINTEVSDPQEVLEAISRKYSHLQQNRLDGISVTAKDFWFNVRMSNTESKVRLNLEAVSQELMEEKRDEVLSLIK